MGVEDARSPSRMRGWAAGSCLAVLGAFSAWHPLSASCIYSKRERYSRCSKAASSASLGHPGESLCVGWSCCSSPMFCGRVCPWELRRLFPVCPMLGGCAAGPQGTGRRCGRCCVRWRYARSPVPRCGRRLPCWTRCQRPGVECRGSPNARSTG